MPEYGYSNTDPVTGYEQAKEIVDTAFANGIRTYDTAASYGKSEAYLKRALERRPAQVITKTKPGQSTNYPEAYAILSHGPIDSSREYDGASVDLPIEAYKVIDGGYHILQVPFNMWQTDMYEPIQEALKSEMTVMIRSVLMQGMMLDWGISVQSALNYVHKRIPEAIIIVGAETVSQVEEVCEIAREWE